MNASEALTQLAAAAKLDPGLTFQRTMGGTRFRNRRQTCRGRRVPMVRVP